MRSCSPPDSALGCRASGEALGMLPRPVCEGARGPSGHALDGAGDLAGHLAHAALAKGLEGLARSLRHLGRDAIAHQVVDRCLRGDIDHPIGLARMRWLPLRESW